MVVPSLRRAAIATAAVLLVLAMVLTSLADASARSDGRSAAPPAGQPLSRNSGASIDPVVRAQLVRNGRVDVLVTLDGASALASARVASAGDSRELLRTTVPVYRALKDDLRASVPGLRILQSYRTLPVVFARVGSRAELERLKADPAVIGIEANRKDELFLSQSLPLINQPAAAAAGHTGAGTAVAVLDTGVDFTRSAFGSCGAPGPTCKVVFAQDFALPDDGLADANGHGTNVAGTVVGVAPDTKILGLDVFSGNTSNAATQVAAIDFAIAQQATYNIRAINMSLGSAETYFTSPCSGVSPSRQTAFANARGVGILPIISSGNNAFSNGSFHAGISAPACIPGALPVGAVYDSDIGSRTWGGPAQDDKCTDATTTADKITCFSQSWTSNQVLAPGAMISAAGITMGGTSQAAPHIAGAVAVLHDAAGVSSDSPSVATPTQVENALLNSGPLIFSSLTGTSFHRLDLPAAVAALGVGPPTTTTPPPTTTTTPPPGLPTIGSFLPAKGKVGASVVITGTDLTGATSVTFDGVSASFAVDLATQITATVPAGATTGPLAVTTPGGTGTSGTNFVVKHARAVSLHFSKAKGNVTVVDGFSQCAANAPVKLQRFRNGKWRTVANGQTKPSGAYNLGNQTAPGRYRTRAAAFTTGSGDRCLKKTSPTVIL